VADPAATVLGLIAGQGALPLELARAARGRGRRLVAIAFHGRTDPALEREAEVSWLHPGEVGRALATLRAAGVSQALLAGKVGKADLAADPTALRPDAEALRLLAALRDRSDDSILRALADFLAGQGIELLPQAELAPELFAGPGVLGSVRPSAGEIADVAYGFPIARAIGGLDIGQTVVVKGRAVLAVEAIEGTDAAIRRAGAIAAGGCVVKVAKPRQDPRFDVPAIGPTTLEAMREASARCLAFEAGRTLLLERARLVAEADAAGIALLGVDDESLAGGVA
jgi:DUF1009 family protein